MTTKDMESLFDELECRNGDLDKNPIGFESVTLVYERPPKLLWKEPVVSQLFPFMMYEIVEKEKKRKEKFKCYVLTYKDPEGFVFISLEKKGKRRKEKKKRKEKEKKERTFENSLI